MKPLAYPYYQQHTDARPFELLRDFTFRTPITGHAVDGPYYLLHATGYLTIRRGYRWDLGTGAIDDPAMVVASLEHDVFCDMVVECELPDTLRPAIDAHFRYRLQQYSRSWMGRAWAWVRWSGVVSYRKLGLSYVWPIA